MDLPSENERTENLDYLSVPYQMVHHLTEVLAKEVRDNTLQSGENDRLREAMAKYRTRVREIESDRLAIFKTANSTVGDVFNFLRSACVSCEKFDGDAWFKVKSLLGQRGLLDKPLVGLKMRSYSDEEGEKHGS